MSKPTPPPPPPKNPSKTLAKPKTHRNKHVWVVIVLIFQNEWLLFPNIFGFKIWSNISGRMENNYKNLISA